jgi:hypothetical protein
MREKASSGLLRVTRAARGTLQKTSLALAGFIYASVVLMGVPIAFYAFSAGSYFAGARVLGILGIIIGVSATLLRVDAMDRFSLDIGDDEPTIDDQVDSTPDNSFRGNLYQEYVLEPRFKKIEYGFYAVGVVFMIVSYIPVF